MIFVQINFKFQDYLNWFLSTNNATKINFTQLDRNGGHVQKQVLRRLAQFFHFSEPSSFTFLF